MVDATDGFNSGHSPDSLQHFLVEAGGTAGSPLIRARDANHQRHHAVRHKARIHMLQREEGADHQPRPGQQHYRQGKFGADQHPAQTIAVRSLAGTAFPLLQGITQVDCSGLPGRSDTERHSREQRNS